MKSLKRRVLLALSFPALWPLIAQSQAAADYPNRPIKILVPFSAGGLGDTVARTISERLAEKFKQSVIVDNRPGASEAIAAAAVATSAPDGYTLLLATETAMVFNPITKKSLPYHPDRDFTPIVTVADSPFYLVVNPSVPAHSVEELSALARKDPAKLTFASIGPGTMQHMLGELLKVRANIDILHVPYRASGPATVALMGNEVNLMFQGGGTVLSLMGSGKVRGLATTAAKRTNAMPDLPTMAELGLPNFVASSWFGLFGPADMPRPIVEHINREVVAVLQEPGVLSKLRPQGFTITLDTPEQLAERIQQDGPYWRKVIQEAKLKFD